MEVSADPITVSHIPNFASLPDDGNFISLRRSLFLLVTVRSTVNYRVFRKGHCSKVQDYVTNQSSNDPYCAKVPNDMHLLPPFALHRTFSPKYY